MSIWHIEYRFETATGSTVSFGLDFTADTMTPANLPKGKVPDWARLENHRCPHCTLPPESTAYCPAAHRLAELLEWSSGLCSYESIVLTVRTPERTVSAETTAQRAISSLMGLLLSTSGCPETEFLRPMARFHLPLASELETVYRAVSMYLLAQYFVERAGRLGDFELGGLRERYRRLQAINQPLCARLRLAVENDSSPNAIVVLDCFARAVPNMIDDALVELEQLFAFYVQR